MAHYKRRKRTDQRRMAYGRKTYLVQGVQRRDYWDYVPSDNVRQKLKRDIWAGWE